MKKDGLLEVIRTLLRSPADRLMMTLILGLVVIASIASEMVALILMLT